MNYFMDQYTIVALGITYLLHSSVWILLVAAILKGKPFRSPFLENTLWKVALVGGLITTAIALLQDDHLVELNKPKVEAIILPSSEQEVTSAVANPTVPIPPFQTDEVATSSPADEVQVMLPSSPSAKSTTSTNSQGLIDWALWVWGGGILLIFLFRIGQHIWFFRRIGKRTIINNPTVLHLMASIQRRTSGPIHFWISTSPFLDSPIVIRGREICLPGQALAEMSEAQLEAMIAHEWAHIVRRDHQWALFLSVLNTLFFFQPLHYLAKKQIKRSNELLCDAQAAQVTGNAIALAECLLTVAGWIKPSTAQPVLVAGMASQQSELSSRITQLLNIPDMKIQRFRKLKLGLPSFLLLAFALVVLPGFRFVTPPAMMPTQIPETNLITALSAERSEKVQEVGELSHAASTLPTTEVERAHSSTADVQPAQEAKPASTAPIRLAAIENLANPPLDEVQPLQPSAFQAKPFQALPIRTSIQKASCADLLRAVKDGDVQLVKKLLQSVDPDCAFYDEGEPRSSLVAAARQGHMEIAQLLLNAKADVEYNASGDESPLMAAANYGHLELVKLLVASGAKVDRKVSGDGTALIGAVRGGHYEVAKYLLEQGANPFTMVSGDEYAMYHARMNGDKAMIKLLKMFENKQ